MQNVTLIAIDLGKHSFHVHAQDKNGNALLRKKFSRTQLTAFLSTCTASTVVMEACAGAHFMTRHICQRGQRVARIWRSVMLASGRYAMIDDGIGFSLVSWRSVIEHRLG
ncbi:DUF3363 domain-containing protein [Pectobacterium aroidearum]|uniref:DUF3363 domain-containing protein n=1 Tax=Pectobacterium aroidearum TaxID=1201031 RepID=UPI003D9C3E8D